MKKLLLMTMLVAVASLFTACENPDTTLVNNLKGSWDEIINDDDYPMQYQFFEGDADHTGKFVEITYLDYFEDVNEMTYDIPYIVIVGGDYAVNDGWLSMTYDPETVEVYFDDEDVLNDFISAYMEYDSETEGAFAEYSHDDMVSILTYLLEEDQIDSCKEFNDNKKDGFSDLTIANGKMSFKTSSSKSEFTRIEADVFDAYPFQD